MDRLTWLEQLRAKRAHARKALDKADTAANRAALEDVELIGALTRLRPG